MEDKKQEAEGLAANPFSAGHSKWSGPHFSADSQHGPTAKRETVEDSRKDLGRGRRQEVSRTVLMEQWNHERDQGCLPYHWLVPGSAI